MFDWFFEGRTTVFVVLAASIAFLFLAWGQTRKRWLLVGVVVAAGLIGLYALLDKMVETDREQIVRKVHELAAAVNARDLDALFANNISDQFRSPTGRTKQELRNAVKSYLDSRLVENVKVWDIVCENPSRDKGAARVFFRAKAKGVRELLADCEADFDFDARHGWRLRGIRLLKPQTTEDWPHQL